MFKKLLMSSSVCLVVFSLFSLVTLAADNATDRHFFTGSGFNDDVLGIAVQSDGKTIAVGKFDNAVGFGSRKIVRLNTDGTVDTSFNAGVGANNNINCVALQADGKILLGGVFTTFDNAPAGRVIRLNQDGSVDSTFTANGGADSSVLAITIQPDGKILVGGNFASFGGVPAFQVARLNTNGSVDSSFTAASNIGLGGEIKSIAVQADNRIVIGGSITLSNGNRGVARLESNGDWDSFFSATVDGNVATVNVVKITSAGIVIGGPFTHVNGTVHVALARLLFTGSRDSSFGSAITVFPTAMAVASDEKIIVSGAAFGSQNLRRVTTDGVVDPTFMASETEEVYAVGIDPDGRVIAGGQFGVVDGAGGARPAGVLRLNTNGTRDASFITQHGAAVGGGIFRSATQPDGKILVVGGFTRLGNLPIQTFGRLGIDGAVDPSFAPPEDTYSAVAVQTDGKIIVAGHQFLDTGTWPIRRLNSNGSIDPTFSATSTTANGAQYNIEDIAVQPDGRILIAGDFEAINGIPRRGIVRLESDGTIDSSFNPNVIVPQQFFVRIRKIALEPGGKIWMAGYIVSNVSGYVLYKLSYSGIGEGYTELGGVGENRINAIFPVNGGKAVVSGSFTSANGAESRGVARIKSEGGLDGSFTPPVTDGFIEAAIPVSSGKILVGGFFQTIGGITRRSLARLNNDGSVDSSYTDEVGPGTTPGIYWFTRQPNGKILVSGNFTSIAGINRTNYSRILDGPLGRTPFDFDGDGKTDVGIFRPSVAEWWIYRSLTGTAFAAQFGASTDKIVPADFTGDGKTDVAVWRPVTGEWIVLRSENNTYYSAPFGASTDVPIPADYDADGKADLAVYRPSTGYWFVNRSSDGGLTSTPFGGNPGDIPIPADYDGDGKADLGIYYVAAGEWWLNRSTAGLIVYQFGNSSDKIAPGDYTGDGKTDIAFWRPVTGEWFVLRSEDGSYFSAPFGASEDIPAPGDYDGDGKFDFTVFRPSSGMWFVNRSSGGTSATPWGASGDQPVATAFLR